MDEVSQNRDEGDSFVGGSEWEGDNIPTNENNGDLHPRGQGEEGENDQANRDEALELRNREAERLLKQFDEKKETLGIDKKSKPYYIKDESDRKIVDYFYGLRREVRLLIRLKFFPVYPISPRFNDILRDYHDLLKREKKCKERLKEARRST